MRTHAIAGSPRIAPRFSGRHAVGEQAEADEAGRGEERDALTDRARVERGRKREQRTHARREDDAGDGDGVGCRPGPGERPGRAVDSRETPGLDWPSRVVIGGLHDAPDYANRSTRTAHPFADAPTVIFTGT